MNEKQLSENELNETAGGRGDFEYRVNSHRCIKCGLCVDVCPTKAISLGEEYAVIDQFNCISCGFCAQNCPTEAIAEPRG